MFTKREDVRATALGAGRGGRVAARMERVTRRRGKLVIARGRRGWAVDLLLPFLLRLAPSAAAAPATAPAARTEHSLLELTPVSRWGEGEDVLA